MSGAVLSRRPEPVKGAHIYHLTGTEYVFVRSQGAYWWVLTSDGTLVSFHREQFKKEAL